MRRAGASVLSFATPEEFFEDYPVQFGLFIVHVEQLDLLCLDSGAVSHLFDHSLRISNNAWFKQPKSRMT